MTVVKSKRKTVHIKQKPVYCTTPVAVVMSMLFSNRNICLTDKPTMSEATTQ
eukprot:CAMPEP_0115555260 /NCGR_PEP_ID=MMETSP0271-20121206/97732_1 /TAXON_ID=71861 /ORGANISM="Scrippsiella trochoidea, Strain CCMP3099" /LENGTH=51 /DNA_ID=CAMNT_0002989041 /DNA_START=21 /DNA_END=173 /DNA_ORIENTATION=-